MSRCRVLRGLRGTVREPEGVDQDHAELLGGGTPLSREIARNRDEN